jgi:hypothetical protein
MCGGWVGAEELLEGMRWEARERRREVGDDIFFEVVSSEMRLGKVWV